MPVDIPSQDDQQGLMTYMVKTLTDNQRLINEIQTKVNDLKDFADRLEKVETNDEKTIDQIAQLRKSLDDVNVKLNVVNTNIDIIKEKDNSRTFVLDTDRKKVMELLEEYKHFRDTLNNLDKKLLQIDIEREHIKEQYNSLSDQIKTINNNLAQIGQHENYHSETLGKIQTSYKVLCTVGVIISFIATTAVSIIGFFIK